MLAYHSRFDTYMEYLRLQYEINYLDRYRKTGHDNQSTVIGPFTDHVSSQFHCILLHSAFYTLIQTRCCHDTRLINTPINKKIIAVLYTQTNVHIYIHKYTPCSNKKKQLLWFFTRRHYASMVYAIALCPCLSVSVKSRSSTETAERIEHVFGTFRICDVDPLSGGNLTLSQISVMGNLEMLLEWGVLCLEIAG